MTLEYITEYIDKKIYKNDRLITVTFYELRIKEDLSILLTEGFKQDIEKKKLKMKKTSLKN